MTLEPDIDQAFASLLRQHDFAAADRFLAQGVDVNRVIPFQEYRDRDLCEDTTTLLIEAAAQGNLTACEYLLAHGADVNFAGAYSGRTALLAAAQAGHLKVVERLLQHGADVLVRDSEDEHTATDYAVARQDTAMTRLLLENGGTSRFWFLNYTLGTPATALDIARLLVSHGTDVNQEDAWGRTPLMWAAERGPLEVVELLLASGADLDRVSSTGTLVKSNCETALQLARKAGRADVTAFLLRRGAQTVRARYERRGLLAWLSRLFSR